jgi:hypothetical protein
VSEAGTENTIGFKQSLSFDFIVQDERRIKHMSMAFIHSTVRYDNPNPVPTDFANPLMFIEVLN